jgi:hypothetical protein
MGPAEGAVSVSVVAVVAAATPGLDRLVGVRGVILAGALRLLEAGCEARGETVFRRRLANSIETDSRDGLTSSYSSPSLDGTEDCLVSDVTDMVYR